METIKTIRYGEVPFVESDSIVRPFDELIDWLDYDDVEIWRLASGKLVAVDCSYLFEDDEPEDCDLEMGFDPYSGCFSDDC